LKVSVQLPPLLRASSGGARVIDAEGGDIRQVMVDLSRRNPMLARHLFDEVGFLRPSIVFLHDGQLIRAADAQTRKVSAGDEIVVTNALSGG